MDATILIIIFLVVSVLLWFTLASAKSTADYYDAYAPYRDYKTIHRIRAELMAQAEDNTTNHYKITQDHPGAIYTCEPFTTTTMKLTTFQQAKEHYRMGYYSLITDGDSYCVLSFPQKHSAKTFLRSSYWTKENEALEDHEITAQTFGENTINQWRMVRAIHPSHYMGEGIKEGDKVVVKDLGEPRTAYTVQNVDNNNSSFRPIGFAGSHYNPEELLPAPFEKQDSQDVLDAIELLKREGKLVDGKILNA